LDRGEKAEGPASSTIGELTHGERVRKSVILLLYAYPKNATSDLTPKQVAQLAKVVKEEFANEKTNV
jgi:hypothetical protein